MSDLTDFLLARIAEDRKVASDAAAYNIEADAVDMWPTTRDVASHPDYREEWRP